MRNLMFEGAAGLTRILVTHVGLSGEAYYARLNTNVNNGADTFKRDVSDYGVRFRLTIFAY